MLPILTILLEVLKCQAVVLQTPAPGVMRLYKEKSTFISLLKINSFEVLKNLEHINPKHLFMNLNLKTTLSF